MQLGRSRAITFRRLGGFVPLGRRTVRRQAQQAKGHGSVHRGHVGVVDLVGAVGDPVIIGKLIGNTQSVSGNSKSSKGQIVAIGEIWIAVFVVFIYLNSGRLGGISPEQFKSCANDPKLLESIQAQGFAAGQDYQVDSTPTFFINGSKMNPNGAQPYEVFDKVLAAAQPN